MNTTKQKTEFERNWNRILSKKQARKPCPRRRNFSKHRQRALLSISAFHSECSIENRIAYYSRRRGKPIFSHKGNRFEIRYARVWKKRGEARIGRKKNHGTEKDRGGEKERTKTPQKKRKRAENSER